MQSRRQKLVKLRQRAQSGFSHVICARERAHAEAGNQGDCFVVIEQQGWEAAPGTQAVPAVQTSCGFHRVAQLSQPGHIPPYGALRHFQTGGEFVRLPGGARFQQPEQAKDALSGFGHVCILAEAADRSCPQGLVSWS
ncbi:hypothetical protein GCM10007061_22820 [Kocuria marina]|nr:hypothetical protein GCM10007061_22820 [Kocuria marina]